MTEKPRPVDDAERQLLQWMNGLEGFISSTDALTLYRTAKALPAGATIVEIGSFKGKSTVCLALGLKAAGNASARVYAVDPFEGKGSGIDVPPTFEAFQQNVKASGVEPWVVPQRMTSEAAAGQWTKPIHLLWIDALHEYPFAVQDLRLWKPFLVAGGKLLMDDLFEGWNEGVCRAFKEEVVFSREFDEVSLSHCLGQATKQGCSWPTLVLRSVYWFAWITRKRWRRALPAWLGR